MLRREIGLACNKTQLQMLRSVAALASPKSIEKSEKIEWKDARPYKDIPGPTLFQSFRAFLPGGKYNNLSMVQFHERLQEEYGLLVKLPGLAGKKDYLFSYHPEDIELVFRTEGVWPVRDTIHTFGYFRKQMRPETFKGRGGLLTEQGEEWQKFRTVVNPVMMQPKIVKLYLPRVDEVTQELIEIAKNKRDDKLEVPADFGRDIHRWALESIGCIALDTRLGLLDSVTKNEESEKFITNMKIMIELLYKLDIMPSIWKFYSTPNFVKLMETFDYLTNTVMKHVDASVQRLQTQSTTADHEMGVLEKLLKIDRDVALIMALDMLLAGVDTTSSSALAALYMLAKNPEKQAKLREELRTVMPTKDTKLTPKIIQNLPYLRACMKESMRILPVTAGNLRRTATDVVIQGYQVPKGSDVNMANMVLQMEDKHFPRSKEYIPERWLKNTPGAGECPHANTAHPFTYLPFGFGPRTCIGRRFANLEVETLLIRMVRQFEIEWHYPDMKITSTLLNTPSGDMKFRLKDVTD